MFTDLQLDLAATVLERCRGFGIRLATAESCTGGLIGGCLTAVAGSSDVFSCGFITYSNAAKNRMLEVPRDLLDTEGAVSQPVARAMAEGVLRLSGTGMTVAVTGISGPGGGTAEKPVGLVHFASAMRNGDTVHDRQVFSGDRTKVRGDTVTAALRLLANRLAAA